MHWLSKKCIRNQGELSNQTTYCYLKNKITGRKLPTNHYSLFKSSQRISNGINYTTDIDQVGIHKHFLNLIPLFLPFYVLY